MRLAFSLLLGSWFCEMLIGAGGSEFVTNSVSQPGHASLQLVCPKGWTFTKKQPRDDLPPTLRMQSKEGGLSLQVTVFWDGLQGKTANKSEAEIEESVRKFAAIQYVPGSVEKRIMLERVKTNGVFGSHARFTDAKYVQQPPPPGEFKNVATGIVRCGDTWSVFTLLTNGKDGPDVREGIAVLESFRQAPATP